MLLIKPILTFSWLLDGVRVGSYSVHRWTATSVCLSECDLWQNQNTINVLGGNLYLPFQILTVINPTQRNSYYQNGLTLQKLVSHHEIFFILCFKTVGMLIETMDWKAWQIWQETGFHRYTISIHAFSLRLTMDGQAQGWYFFRVHMLYQFLFGLQNIRMFQLRALAPVFCGSIFFVHLNYGIWGQEGSKTQDTC